MLQLIPNEIMIQKILLYSNRELQQQQKQQQQINSKIGLEKNKIAVM